MFVANVTDNDLYSVYYKELLQISKKEMGTIENLQESHRVTFESIYTNAK
jgi:hypothetical protein